MVFSSNIQCTESTGFGSSPLFNSQPVYFYTTIYLAEVVVVSYRQPVHTTSLLLNAYTDARGHDDTDDDGDTDDDDSGT